ncbi:MAG: phytoene/squalene synthase family protein [Chloroflexota bacterium]
MGESQRATVRHAARITRSRARSFYLSSLFLPASIRRDVYIMYAYYRAVDDLVDDPPAGWTRARICAELRQWSNVIAGIDAPASPLMGEVARVIRARGVQPKCAALVIEGALLDLDRTEITTREELLRYAYLVAGSVGMVMARILGANGRDALGAAADLGIAMQITNIVRDVAEDLDRSRVYLPSDAMQRHGCSMDALRSRQATPGFRAVMEELVGEAERHYETGTAGIAHLQPRIQFAIYLAARLYSGILRKVVKRNYDVFSERAHVGLLEKWANVVPAYLELRKARLHL